MKIAKTVSFLGIVAMTGILSYAFLKGNFSEEGTILLNMPWGIVSLVDLYVGFILFSAWIVFRERAFLPSLVWVILMMTLGFFTASLYVFIALQRSNGDWKRFFFGKRYVK